MKKNFCMLIFFTLNLILFGQKRLYSPLKLENYENLKKEYINSINENKDKLKLIDHFYLIKNKLDSIPNIENNLKSIFTIQKDNFTYYYSPSRDQLYISYNHNLKIDYWFQSNTNSEFISNEKLRTWNIYFSINGQLKETNTFLLPYKEIVGISEQYNIIGKRLFYANWDKDFKYTKQQIIKLCEKYLYEGIKDYASKNKFDLNETEITNVIKDYLKTKPEIYKNINKDREPTWFIIYTGSAITKMNISDKTGKLINFEVTNIIE